MKEGDKVTCVLKHKNPCLQDPTDEHPNGTAYVRHTDGCSAYLRGNQGNIGSRACADLEVIELNREEMLEKIKDGVSKRVIELMIDGVAKDDNVSFEAKRYNNLAAIICPVVDFGADRVTIDKSWFYSTKYLNDVDSDAINKFIEEGAKNVCFGLIQDSYRNDIPAPDKWKYFAGGCDTAQFFDRTDLQGLRFIYTYGIGI